MKVAMLLKIEDTQKSMQRFVLLAGATLIPLAMAIHGLSLLQG
ncbi:MAG TPA: hypothetical protein VLC92_07045 [Rhodocyclaceae bacterium]|nr:hypothetical protein [Rhodocyclaceae bacterium]